MAVLLYLALDQSWWLFVALFFASAYNAAHTTVLPLILAAIGVLGDRELATGIAVIWLTDVVKERALSLSRGQPHS